MNDAAKLEADRSGWRLSKEIPVSVVGFIVVQTILLTFFLASQNAKLESVVTDNALNKISQYTKDDARKDRELIDQKLVNIGNKEDEITRRIALLEAQANQLQARIAK